MLGYPNSCHRGTPPQEASNCLLKFPVNGLPPGSPKGPYGERDLSPVLSSTRSLVIHLSLKVPGK